MFPSRLMVQMRSLYARMPTRDNSIFFGFFMSSGEPVSIAQSSSILMFQTLMSLSEEQVTKCSSSIQSSPKMPPLWAFSFSAMRQYLRLSCRVSLRSAPPVRMQVPLGLYLSWLMKPLWDWSDFLNEQGGPSQNFSVISSPPSTSLNGRSGLKEHEFNVPDTPVISPAFVPVSTNPTLPNEFFPSPTAQMRLPSALQSMLLALAKKLSYCLATSNLSGQISLMMRVPLASMDATNRPSGLNLAAVMSDRWTRLRTGLVGSWGRRTRVAVLKQRMWCSLTSMAERYPLVVLGAGAMVWV